MTMKQDRKMYFRLKGKKDEKKKKKGKKDV